ncbi:MAG TPA: lytic murein transglycosylase B [Mariprofundaceae bacterium]|nr:lytic murein transglycosylase B [Mariprofundaceae bacterium]
MTECSTQATPDSHWRRLLRGVCLGMLLPIAMPVALCHAAPPPTSETTATPVPVVDKGTLLKLLQSETGLSAEELRPALDSARFDPSVITRMETPYEAKPYAQYRPLFVYDRLAQLGRHYLDEHRAIFQEAWKRYGVEPEIIASILAIETHFGEQQGSDRVLDSLYTLASGYPRRADFFRKELGEYLKLCHAENLDPDSIIGSYAGAFGVPQFIPSSYMAYAVDGNGDGHRDVWHSPRDIIFSVANYFHQHGWQPRLPVARWLSQEPATKPLLDQRGKEMQDWQPLQKLYAEGLQRLPASWRQSDPVALITMQPGDHDRTAVVSRNFYVITRWNRSYNYAMATTELAHLMGCGHCGTGL